MWIAQNDEVVKRGQYEKKGKSTGALLVVMEEKIIKKKKTKNKQNVKCKVISTYILCKSIV